MVYEESVTGVRGFAGTIPIGRAHFGSWRWHVEIFHKAPDLRAHSWREARQLLAVHGADRVELHYAVHVTWPGGIDPPFAGYLPRGSSLIPTRFAAPQGPKNRPADKFFSLPSVWQRSWSPAFDTGPK